MDHPHVSSYGAHLTRGKVEPGSSVGFLVSRRPHQQTGKCLYELTALLNLFVKLIVDVPGSMKS